MDFNEDDIKKKFKNIELKQLEKHNEKLSSALVVGMIIGAIGIGYKVTKSVMKFKRKK
ncbi:hypothetical protein [Clostridium sp.]|uniref:hypothetical protein n=1 Tax=Clostridium sp. TaxID=1506 RepID=UPI003217CF86